MSDRLTNLNQIKQQYFMHPDTPDDEVLVQVNDIEMAIHKETITDINYIPKTLEEAKQHPLWVDGHLPLVKIFYNAWLVLFTPMWLFLTYSEVHGPYSWGGGLYSDPYAPTFLAIALSPYILLMIYCSISAASNRVTVANKPHILVPITMVLSFIWAILANELFDDNNSSITVSLKIPEYWFGFVMSLPFLLLPMLIQFKSYKFIYMAKYKKYPYF